MDKIFEIQNPLDKQLQREQQAIREGVRQIEEFPEIKYVPGFEQSVGFFPSLESIEGHPVLARFSYGEKAPNMSSVFFDSDNGESEVTGDRNTREFLESQGFTGPFIQALGKFEGREAQIEEVDLDTLKDKVKVVGNVVFTRDPRITLIIKPADCPTGILYCKDSLGNDVTAIIHGGADAINAGLTRQGLQALQIELGVDLSEARLAIFPGVSKDNFFISRQWRLPNGEIRRRETGIFPLNWGEFISEQKTDDPEEKRYVDITSAFEMQALQAGMSVENIQAYRRDTYEDADAKIAYSRRYTNEMEKKTGKRVRDGGQIVATQITPQKAQNNLQQLQAAA